LASGRQSIVAVQWSNVLEPGIPLKVILFVNQREQTVGGLDDVFFLIRAFGQ
jgi:hypothetical protein